MIILIRCRYYFEIYKTMHDIFWNNSISRWLKWNHLKQLKNEIFLDMHFTIMHDKTKELSMNKSPW